MDIEPTQALPLSDFEDEDVNESSSAKEVVGKSHGIWFTI